jgi:hypothetical protein
MGARNRADSQAGGIARGHQVAQWGLGQWLGPLTTTKGEGILTTVELQERANTRAQVEQLISHKLSTGNYLVRSRFLAPGAFHLLNVADGRVNHCDCPAWGFRGVCAHAATVERRLARESKKPQPVPLHWADSLREPVAA